MNANDDTRSTTPPADNAVEAVARIIDPDAWHEKLPTDGLAATWICRRNKAREKARAAISAYDRTRGVERSVFEPTDEELAAIRAIGAEQDLSDAAVVRQALRHYQLIHERLKAGETFSFSGDAARAAEFAALPQPSGIERLVEALEAADGALRNYACQGPGAPCLRTPAQCADNCGLGAAQALEAVESALSSLKESGRQQEDE
jgi:hypothetical protein